MTEKERYCTGRAEYLAEHSGCSVTEGYRIAEREWEANFKRLESK